jgi:hypothetical protein
MTDWIPKRRSIAVPETVLDRDERFVLARVDGTLSVEQLAGLAGISPATVESILDRLVSRGAVLKTLPPRSYRGYVEAEPVSAEEAAALPELEIVPDDEPDEPDEPDETDDADDMLAVPVDTTFRPGTKRPTQGAPPMAVPPPPSPPLLYLASQSLANADGAELEELPDDDEEGLTESAVQMIAGATTQNSEVELEDVASFDDGEMPDLDQLPMPVAPEQEAPADKPLDEKDEKELADLGSDASYLRIYATNYKHLTVDQRMVIVNRSTDRMGPPEAMALDPDPKVIKALFENPYTQLKHARLAAFHHRSSAGLDALAARGDLLRDAQVQRLLLRNPITGDGLVRRILQPRRLGEIFKTTLDREVPDKTRVTSRNILRSNFTKASSEDKFSLIWNTEARVLPTLVGCTLDARTTATICGKPVTSIALVSNFARWGATPPAVLAHFLKQNFVRRQANLKKMLLQHPNCPSDAKRGA